MLFIWCFCCCLCHRYRVCLYEDCPNQSGVVEVVGLNVAVILTPPIGLLTLVDIAWGH